jgi:hypothetical protein
MVTDYAMSYTKSRKPKGQTMTREEFDRRFAASQDTTEGYTDAELDGVNDKVYAEVQKMEDYTSDKVRHEIQNMIDHELELIT